MRCLAVVLAAVCLLAGCGTTTHDSQTAPAQGTPPVSSRDPGSGLPWIEASALPSQGRTALREIDHGGPFAFPGKDGSVFGNLEGILPQESRGYYHEYTVPTPGASNRGTRRIIAGSRGELYWTADHYEHFERIKR